MRGMSERAWMVIAACGVGSASALGGVEYEMVIIEPWDQDYALAISRVADINNLNQVTGCAHPLSGGCSFLWTLEGDKEQINLAGPINDNGVIVAAGYLRWPDGTLQELDGAISSLQDINNQNIVSGTIGSFNCFGGPHGSDDKDFAAVWEEGVGTIPLDTTYGVVGAEHAIAINELNQVVGVTSSTGDCGNFKAFYLDLETGEHINLHEELLGGAMGITTAVDINDAGMVIGQGDEPFIWTKEGGFQFLPALPDGDPLYTTPEAINNLGTVVGQGLLDEGGWHAFVWDEAQGVRDLNELVELPDDFIIDTAKKINDNGWIIGKGHYGAWSPERAVVLIPISPADKAEDLDKDGAVDSADLNMLLGEFGCTSGCTADIDGDGSVGSADLNMLLAAFGDTTP